MSSLLLERGFLAVDAVSTLLILHLFLDLLNKSRTDAKTVAVRNYFKDVAMLATQEASRHNAALEFSVGVFPMYLLPTGKVLGFRSRLGRHVHKNVAQTWLATWSWMARENNGPLVAENAFLLNPNEEPIFVDLVIFCVDFVNSYKAAHSTRHPSSLSMDSMRDLQRWVLKFVASVITTVVLEMMTQQEDSQPLPSRRLRR